MRIKNRNLRWEGRLVLGFVIRSAQPPFRPKEEEIKPAKEIHATHVREEYCSRQYCFQ